MRTPPTPITQATSPALITTQGWQARSILIDNPGGQWVTLPDQDVTIGPFTTGAVVPTTGTQQVRVMVLAPSDQINSGRGTNATIILDSRALPASPGSSIPGATTSDINSLGKYLSSVGTQPSVAATTFTQTIFNNVIPFDAWITRFDLGVIPAITSTAFTVFEWVLRENTTNSVLARGVGQQGATGATTGPTMDIVRYFNPPIFVAANTVLALNVVCTRHDSTNWGLNALYCVTGVQYSTALQ